jgi:hypothetical protein
MKVSNANGVKFKVNHPPVPTPTVTVTMPKPPKPLIVEKKKK